MMFMVMMMMMGYDVFYVHFVVALCVVSVTVLVLFLVVSGVLVVHLVRELVLGMGLKGMKVLLSHCLGT